MNGVFCRRVVFSKIVDVVLECFAVQESDQPIRLFFFWLVLYINILVDIEELLGIFLTIKKVLEFTGKPCLAVGTNVLDTFRRV